MQVVTCYIWCGCVAFQINTCSTYVFWRIKHNLDCLAPSYSWHATIVLNIAAHISERLFGAHCVTFVQHVTLRDFLLTIGTVLMSYFSSPNSLAHSLRPLSHWCTFAILKQSCKIISLFKSCGTFHSSIAAVVVLFECPACYIFWYPVSKTAPPCWFESHIHFSQLHIGSQESRKQCFESTLKTRSAILLNSYCVFRHTNVKGAKINFQRAKHLPHYH